MLKMQEETKMKHQHFKQVLQDTIATVCDEFLSFDQEIKVEGVLGISVDNKETIMVHILEGITKDLPVCSLCNHCGVNAIETISINKRLSTKPLSSSTKQTVLAEKQQNERTRSKRSTPPDATVHVIKAEVHNPPGYDGNSCALPLHVTQENGQENASPRVEKEKAKETECEEIVLESACSNEISTDEPPSVKRKKPKRSSLQSKRTPIRNKVKRRRSLPTRFVDEIQPIRSTTPGEGFECYICNKVFSIKYIMMRHVKQVHLKEKNFSCNECGRKFYDKTKLQTHHQVVHQSLKHVCSYCPKEFRSIIRLSEHMASHGKKTNFTCSSCSSSFDDCLSYTQHLKSHMVLKDAKEANHECETCGRMFQSKGGRNIHMKMCGSLEKPHKCHVCNKAFAQGRYLKEHLKLHNEPMRYECDVCGKRFDYRKSFLLHMEKKHPKVVE